VRLLVLFGKSRTEVVPREAFWPFRPLLAKGPFIFVEQPDGLFDVGQTNSLSYRFMDKLFVLPIHE
jgi:hypothetical protein